MSQVLREDNHIVVKMPNSEVIIYVNYDNKKAIVPLKLFKSEIDTEMHSEPALELYLWNSWSLIFDVSNIGLDNLYSKTIISPAASVLVCEGTLLIQRAGDDVSFQINMSDNSIYITNTSQNVAEALKPVHKGEKIPISLESPLVDQDGQILLSISIPDSWVNEDWN